MKKEISYNSIIEEQINLGEFKYTSTRNNAYLIIRYNDYATIKNTRVITALEARDKNEQFIGLAHIIECEFDGASSAQELINHAISTCSEHNIIIASVNKYAKYFEQNRFMKIITSESMPSINLYKNLNTYIYINNQIGREACIRAMFGMELLDLEDAFKKQEYVLDTFKDNNLDYDNAIIMPLYGREYIVVWYSNPQSGPNIIGRYPAEIISSVERSIPISDGIMHITLNIDVEESDWSYDTIAERYCITKSISRAIDNIIYAPEDFSAVEWFDITIEDNDLKLYNERPRKFSGEIVLRAIIV